MRESPRALEAFAIYAELGAARSLDRVHARLRQTSEKPATLRTVQEWSRLHGWTERLAAHERAIAAEAEEAEREKRRKLRDARIGVAVEMQTIGLRALREKQARDISAPAAVAMIHEAHETQRKDSGEPDQRVEVGGPDGAAIVFEVRHVQRGDSIDASADHDQG